MLNDAVNHLFKSSALVMMKKCVKTRSCVKVSDSVPSTIALLHMSTDRVWRSEFVPSSSHQKRGVWHNVTFDSNHLVRMGCPFLRGHSLHNDRSVKSPQQVNVSASIYGFDRTQICIFGESDISIRWTPQMVADKEAIRPTAYRESTHTILSVTCPYSHCAFTTYLSTLFLSVLTLLACTQSVDNLYHALTVLWENEYLVTYNLLCCFTSLKLHHLII